MTLQEIIKCHSCRDLFPDNKEEAKKIYISLIKKYHPDVCKDPLCDKASAIINNLYNKTKKLLKSETFSNPQNNIQFDFLRRYEREDGFSYFSENSIYYLLDGKIINKVKPDILYRNISVYPDVYKQAKIFLPDVRKIIYTEDMKIFINIAVEKNEMPLDEFLDFFDGKPDARHCAWIISRLLGICCFAEINNIVFNCLCTENILINPELHTLRITGGWWFSSLNGEKMTGVQSEVYQNMPVSCHTDGIARKITDLESVKAICRKIFPEDSPEPLMKFSESICMNDAFSEMEFWENTIDKAFGGKYFTKINLCLADIYN